MQEAEMNVTAICSMLHEAPSINDDSPRENEPVQFNSATRLFRGEPVLSWTLSRLCRSKRVCNVAILCWEDQLGAVEEIAEDCHAYILAKGPRQPLGMTDAVAAARRWTDGWRGGLLGACDFDLGFYAPWIKELFDRLESDAALLIDPSAGLIDANLIDELVDHAIRKDHLELAFSQAAPGLSGVLLRPALLERLAGARAYPGHALHYSPRLPSRDPIGTDACVEVATPIARSLHNFKLNSQRQIARIARASHNLNGTLATSAAATLIQRFDWPSQVDELPREIVIELNTNRASRPIFWPGRHLKIARGESIRIESWADLFRQAAHADDMRLTIAGVGDPLESDLLFPVIDAAAAAGIRAIRVETDLLAVDISRVENLARSPIDLLSVNIPAMSPATYEKMMGVNELTRVLQNVTTFIRERNARGTTTPLLVPTFVKCEQNIAEMETWYDQWLGALGCAVIEGPSDFGGRIPNLALADMSPTKRGACVRLTSRISVLCDGSVVSCEQDVCGKNIVGNVKDQTLREVWTTKSQPLRAAHACGEWKSNPTCATCREWHRP